MRSVSFTLDGKGQANDCSSVKVVLVSMPGLFRSLYVVYL